MAKINGIIPQHNYELIRDRIGLILGIELANQFTLNGENFAPSIFIERVNPFDKIEVPTVNVSLFTGNYDSKNQGDSRGTYQFHVDVYCKAKTSSTIEGDVKAMYNTHRLIGICRAILENPVYKTLDFDAPSISRTSCDSFEFAKTVKDDACNVTMARLVFTVVCHETTELKTARTVQNWYTVVKLSDTDEGYVYDGRALADFNNDFNKDASTV